MGLQIEPLVEALNAQAPGKHLVGEIQRLKLGPGRSMVETKLKNKNFLKYLDMGRDDLVAPMLSDWPHHQQLQHKLKSKAPV